MHHTSCILTHTSCLTPHTSSLKSQKMRAFITGGAGFIGSNLSDRLLHGGHAITIFDNFSTGHLRFLKQARSTEKFRLIEGDLLDEQALNQAIAGHDMVFHLAANADVRPRSLVL